MFCMIRKVIQLAGKTLVVSMPSKWARRSGIEKGSDVTVDEKGDCLLISAASNKRKFSTEIDLSGTMPMTKRVLGALFKLGYEEVKARFSTAEELSAVQEAIREEFIGFEVVKRTKDSIEIKNVTRLDETEFDTIVRRMFLALLGMAEESLQAIAKEDALWLSTIVLADKDINKYADFCRRLLNQKGLSVSERPMPTYYIIEQLERIGDSYRDICDEAILGKRLSKPGEKLYSETTNFFRLLYEFYYNFSLDKAVEISKKRKSLKNKISELVASARKDEFQILMLLDKLIDDIFDLNGAVMASRL
jgi:phosphate uptake regulator